MTMTKDQKHALYIGGGIAAIAVLFYLWSRAGVSIVPPGSSVQPGPSIADVPGAMDYNVQPLVGPPSVAQSGALPNNRLNNPLIGQGCCSKYDGCFNNDPLASGNGPLSIAALFNNSGSDALLAAINKTVTAYPPLPPNLSDQAAPRPTQLVYLTSQPQYGYLNLPAGGYSGFGAWGGNQVGL